MNRETAQAWMAILGMVTLCLLLVLRSIGEATISDQDRALLVSLIGLYTGIEVLASRYFSTSKHLIVKVAEWIVATQSLTEAGNAQQKQDRGDGGGGTGSRSNRDK